jgi:putative transposase
MEERYRKNAGAVYSLKYHIVWCPKFRRPVLIDAVADRLRALLAESSAELGVNYRRLKATVVHLG